MMRLLNAATWVSRWVPGWVSRWVLSGFLLASLLFTPWATAQSGCQDQAQTELEAIYCQVQLAGTGASLPRFHEFRRNSPQVQASLLRGPARRAGLTLPEVTAPSRSAPPAPRQPAEPAAPSAPPAPAAGAGGSFSDAVNRQTAPDPVAPPAASVPTDPLADCQLQAATIHCEERRYRLQRNQANSELAAGVLQQQNRLGLQPFQGDLDDEPAVRRYLSDSYRRYIQKMVGIGLGASTMSYTKFYHTFWQLQEQGGNFAQRFDAMFQYLQQDKASLAVKPLYTDELPVSIHVCMLLTPELVVCDNRDFNWVYSRVQ